MSQTRIEAVDLESFKKIAGDFIGQDALIINNDNKTHISMTTAENLKDQLVGKDVAVVYAENMDSNNSNINKSRLKR